MRKLPFLILWLSLAGLPPAGPAEGQSPAPATPPVATATPAPATPPVPAATSPALEAAAVLAEARRVEEHTENQVSLIVTLMEIFMGAVTLVTIILIGIGLREWKQVEDALKRAEAKAAETLRQVDDALNNAETKTTASLKQTEERVEASLAEAEAAARRAQEAAERGQYLISNLEDETEAAKRKAEEATRLAEENSRQIKEMRTSLVEAWGGEIRRAFSDLPDLEAEWEFSFKVRELPPEDRIRIVDLDALCVICDRLKIPGDLETLIDSFLQMGRYWRFVDEYPRAMVRVDRALALANAEETERRCRLHRARIFIQWVTYKPGRRRAQHLASAKSDLDRIRQIQGGDDASTLFEEAWIADIEERYEDALKLWAEARQAEVREGKSEGLWRYGYNVACTLTRADRLQEAVEELRKLVGTGPEWIVLAAGDPDLEKLKTHPDWGQELEALLEEARQAFSG